jgi:hypothetical protein
MLDTSGYYEAQDKMKLVVVPEWVFYHEDESLTSGFLDDGKKINEINLWEDSMVFALVGHRGSGKTTLATALSIQGRWLWPELRVISNYPMKWGIKNRSGKIKVYKSEPLDLVKMVNFDADYQHSLIVLDECPAILNRMGMSSNRNKIINLWIQQLRKNRNSLVLCSQDFKLIDYEAQYQTDIVIYCKDAYRRYPASGVKRGGVVLMDMIDHSGQWTGYTYDEKPVARRQRLCSEYVWGTFDTYFQLDIIEQLWRLEIQRERVVVGNNGQDEYLANAGGLFKGLQAEGSASKDCVEVYKTLGIDDSQGKKRELGIRMERAGCGRQMIGKAWAYTNLDKFSIENFLSEKA